MNLARVVTTTNSVRRSKASSDCLSDDGFGSSSDADECISRIDFKDEKLRCSLIDHREIVTDATTSEIENEDSGDETVEEVKSSSHKNERDVTPSSSSRTQLLIALRTIRAHFETSGIDVRLLETLEVQCFDKKCLL